jgi:hypothetical protein
MKRGGDISIYVEGEYLGTLTSYFSEGTPICGQAGTVILEYKPGTYSYKATNNNSTWTGTVTIYSGICRLEGLVK